MNVSENCTYHASSSEIDQFSNLYFLHLKPLLFTEQQSNDFKKVFEKKKTQNTVKRIF